MHVCWFVQGDAWLSRDGEEECRIMVFFSRCASVVQIRDRLLRYISTPLWSRAGSLSHLSLISSQCCKLQYEYSVTALSTSDAPYLIPPHCGAPFATFGSTPCGHCNSVLRTLETTPPRRNSSAALHIDLKHRVSNKVELLRTASHMRAFSLIFKMTIT